MTGASAGSAWAGGTGYDAAAVVTGAAPGGSGTWSGAMASGVPSSGGGSLVSGTQAGAASGIWPRTTGAGGRGCVSAPSGTGAPRATTGGPRVTAGAWAAADPAQPASVRVRQPAQRR